ncbi:putative mediator of RNA polymerase II transcription subunit 26 isoform X7 [Sitodiplosis mosellana]|uniref:putative mediator of RNA polymerase II transcription subunit 26 isoform X7 n=1 Tax=Sitodiplosis mosellana TaxID=263140 RepID=UPI00244477CA|nr:putative mediator of RNA polymerase II transcription subunit 26 isoform X7 [Sitodiplosis mosellana]XP_055318932.1 putative mediator of RNA polymerase II transcription subunit 26 isoform X7 [Sitodiplosis mosellana]XP_055318933.1 putative mediator of RNA polymerase II transcription subunit 26 isoform X7 [Sitodiplosis mosellana]
MKDVSEVCYRSLFGRNFGVLIGTIASIYIATKGFQYISKKITDKRRIALKKPSENSSSSSTATTADIEPHSNENNIEPSLDRNPFDYCSICQIPLDIVAAATKSNNDYESDSESEIDKFASCHLCQSQICKSPQCGIWLAKHNHWECTNCHHFDSVVYVPAYEWIFKQLNRRFDDKASAVERVTKTEPIHDTNPKSNDDDVMLELNDESSPIPLQQRVRVREFIEDLLASMLGGSLDHVCVGQIYKNLEYLPILEHEKNPGVSYENLRKIVHTIVQEVIKLPEFCNQKGLDVDTNQVQSSFEPKIYEDLLATAVINKIVETYNDKKYENSSGIHSGGSDLDSSCHIDQTNQNFILNSRCSSTDLKSEYSSAFNERYRSPSMKTADIIDEIFREKLGKENYQSSASASASARSELSDYIQNHKISLPDFEFNDNEIDIADEDSDEIEQEFQSIYANSTGFETNYNELSDNWLFRKVVSRNYMNGGGGSASSIASASSPVGMLVPSPRQDCPTLIGNRNAEEISDLSENGSDIDSLPGELHSDTELNYNGTSNAHDLPHVLVESKTLIGGKNEMNAFEQSKVALINLLEPDSLVSEQSLTGQSPAISEAKNNLILIEDRPSPIPAKRMNRFTDDSIEHTFTYSGSNEMTANADLLIKFDSLEAYNQDTEYRDHESNNVEILNKNDNNSFDKMHAFDQSLEDVNRFTGSIAEREHMKWRNAVELPNNPYSAEALQRRLSQSSNTKFMDIERLAGKFEANIESKPLSTPNQSDKPIKVVLGAKRVNPERYGRDYYINDSKTASGSRALRTSGDLNRHRTIDDDDDDNYYNDGRGSVTSNTPENDYDENHSLLVGDIEVVSTTESNACIQSDSGGSFTEAHSTTKIATTTLHTAQPIQVDEHDPILDKATKLDHLCSKDRDYYLLHSEAVSAEEYAKLSLGSETTATDDDSIGHVQQSSSLPHCDDSLSTTVSEESDCTATVRVYDLNKRETKILRHDIIKRSRNPVGGESINTFDNLGNCCSEITATATTTTTTTTSTFRSVKERSDSPLQSTIQHFNSRILENANETRKPPRSPTKLKSIHLNRNPRKLKMADVQLMNDAFGTSLDPKIIDELKQQRQSNGDIFSEIESSTVAIVVNSGGDSDKDLGTATEQLLDSERESSKVCVVQSETTTAKAAAAAEVVATTTQCQVLEKPQEEEAVEQKPQEEEPDQEQQQQEHAQLKHESEQQFELEKPEMQTEQSQEQQQSEEPVVCAEHTKDVLVNVSASDHISDEFDDDYTDAQNDQHHNGNDEIHCFMADRETAIDVPTTKNDDNDNYATAADDQYVEHISNEHCEHNHVKAAFERNSEVIVQVNEHKEKSVIEEDVISALPSVKALARTFSTKNNTNTVPEKLQRPKMVWRNSYNGPNNNDINVKDQNGNDPSSPTYVPNFNHAYNPVAPGYSITARSLSTKFREELRNATDDSNNEKDGRLSPERPSSPVLVPGILKNNIAFFENLRKK